MYLLMKWSLKIPNSCYTDGYPDRSFKKVIKAFKGKSE